MTSTSALSRRIHSRPARVLAVDTERVITCSGAGSNFATSMTASVQGAQYVRISGKNVSSGWDCGAPKPLACREVKRIKMASWLL